MSTQTATTSVVGIILGALLIVIAILKPAFLWNFQTVVTFRASMGDMVARTLFGAAGLLMLGGGVWGLVFRKKS